MGRFLFYMSSNAKSRFAINILFFICGINFATWATRIPDYKENLQISDGELGSILVGLPIGSIISLPIAGKLIARFNSKKISLLAVILYMMVLPIISIIHHPILLFCGLFAFGMAGDILNIAMNTQVISLEERMNKIIMSSFHAVFSFGLMFGSLLGGALNKNFSIQEHFLLITTINFISIFIFYPFLLPDPSHHSETNSKLNIFKFPKKLIILSLVALCGMLSEGAMADWIPLYFKEFVLDNPFNYTIGFTSFGIAMVIGRLLGDWASNTFGIKNILSLSGLAIFIGMGLNLLSAIFILKVLGCFIIGLGIATIVPLVYSAAGKTKEISPSIAIAGVSTIAYAGFLMGPPLIGFLSEWITLPLALSLIAILGFSASLISFFSPSVEAKK